MLSEAQRRFLAARRTAHLATADKQGRPHDVPVCFAVIGNNVYIAIDRKPKGGDASRLRRLRNIEENSAVALIADHYDDTDWSRLGWVMLRGEAEILFQGPEHAQAQRLVQARYPQVAAMDLTGLPVIAIRIAKATKWGTID